MTPVELAVALRLATTESRRLAGRARHRGVDPEDLLQSGLVAAILALRSFNPELGTLEHHLLGRIRSAEIRELRRLSIPVQLPRDDYKTRALAAELEDSHGQCSTDLQEMAIDGRRLVVRMSALAGVDGALVVSMVLAGLMTRGEAAEVLGLSERDLGTVIAAMLREVRE